jgi:hypothetical protein
MASDECSIQQLMAQLRTTHFQSYLLSHGWVETSSSQMGQIRFEADIPNEEGVYEMYLPVSAAGAKHQTRLLRNIYKLCGIEDREPADIAREMINDHAVVEPPIVALVATRLRVHNSASSPMHVSVDSPAREHILYANEAIELTCGRSDSIQIERTENAVVIRTVTQR